MAHSREEPFPVIVVSYGENHWAQPRIDQWLEELHDKGVVMKIIDYRKRMADPSMNVNKGEHGKTASTCRAVYAMAKPSNWHGDSCSLTDNLEELLDFLLEHPECRVVGGYCTTGFHRADTTGRILQDMLNSIVDQDGNQIYNCLHVTAAECLRHWDLGEAIRSGHQWIMDGPFDQYDGPRLHKHRYGHDMCRGYSVSKEGFDSVWEWFDSRYLSTTYPADRTTTIDAQAVDSSPEAHGDGGPHDDADDDYIAELITAADQGDDHGDETVAEEGQVGDEYIEHTVDEDPSLADIPHRPRPFPLRPRATAPALMRPSTKAAAAPSAAGAPSAAAAALMRASTKAAAAPSVPRSRKQKRRDDGPVRIAPLPKQRRPETQGQDIADPMPAEMDDLPEWAQLGPKTDITVWWELLDKYNIDERNRTSLFNLSQSSNIGHFEAARCIHDLSKHDILRSPIKSFNRWFQSTITNARARVQENFGLFVRL